MKKTTCLLLTLCPCLGALAQGNLNFNNLYVNAIYGVSHGPNNPPVFAPFLGDPGRQAHGYSNVVNYTGGKLSGTNFIAQLWAGPAGVGSNSLSFVAQSTMRTGILFGYWSGIVVSIPGVDAGQAASLQVRVFDNTSIGGPSAVGAAAWAAVWQPGNEFGARGTSRVWQSQPLTVPPFPPPSMVGFGSFNVHFIPEPSTYALCMLGLGALLLRRRQ